MAKDGNVRRTAGNGDKRTYGLGRLGICAVTLLLATGSILTPHAAVPDALERSVSHVLTQPMVMVAAAHKAFNKVTWAPGAPKNGFGFPHEGIIELAAIETVNDPRTANIAVDFYAIGPYRIPLCARVRQTGPPTKGAIERYRCRVDLSSLLGGTYAFGFDVHEPNGTVLTHPDGLRQGTVEPQMLPGPISPTDTPIPTGPPAYGETFFSVALDAGLLGSAISSQNKDLAVRVIATQQASDNGPQDDYKYLTVITHATWPDNSKETLCIQSTFIPLQPRMVAYVCHYHVPPEMPAGRVRLTFDVQVPHLLQRNILHADLRILDSRVAGQIGSTFEPANFRNAYDANVDATGQTIGIILDGNPVPQVDLDKFSHDAGVPRLREGTSGRDTVHWNMVDPTIPHRKSDAGRLELAADVEYLHAMAWHSHIEVWLVPDITSYKYALDGIRAAVKSHVAIVSDSWGLPNWYSARAQDERPSVKAISDVLREASRAGTTFFFGSGDSGDLSGCNDPGHVDTCLPDVNAGGHARMAVPPFPAESPFVATVGGMAPRQEGDNTLPSGYRYTKAAWDGSGRGCSRYFRVPSWQRHALSTTGYACGAALQRAIPDVAAAAAPQPDGALVWYEQGTPIPTNFTGTSLATPIWAGMAADLNHYLAAHHKPPTGFMPPTLYALGMNPATRSRDFPHAGNGWDATLGWGDPNLTHLEEDWASMDITPVSTPRPAPSPHACRSTFTHANWPRPIPFPTITIDEPCSGQTFNALPGHPLVFKGTIHGQRLPHPLRLQFNVSAPSDLNFGTLAFKDLQGFAWEYSWPIDDWLSGRYMFQMLAVYTAGPEGYGSIARRMIDIRTRWSKLAPLPLDRSDLGTAYGPDGRLYAIGGVVSTDAPTEGVITNSRTAEVLALRPGDKQWTSVAPLPLPLAAPLVVTLHDGRILVIGGQSDELEAVSSVYAYDAGQGRWSTLASLPQPREDASATVGQDGKVYVIGGSGYYGQKVLPTEIYDPSSNTWSLAPAPPKSADGGAAVALADGRIVVVGGLVVARSQGGIELDRSQAQVYAFDPVLRTWRSLRPLPIWRYGMDATTDAEGNIIVLGGHSSMTDDQRFTAEVDKYDVRSGSWERFGFGEIVQRGAIARGNGGVSFLIGGHLNNFSNPARTTVETAVTRYDPNFNG